MTDQDAVTELRSLVDERVAAIRARDTGPLNDRQHPEVLTFNVIAPLRLEGRDAVAHQTSAWFAAYHDGPHYDVHDVRIDAEHDLGYCSYIYRVSGTMNDGSEVDMAVRATLVYKRIDGRWCVVHDHESVPFDPETGKALIDLQP